SEPDAIAPASAGRSRAPIVVGAQRVVRVLRDHRRRRALEDGLELTVLRHRQSPGLGHRGALPRARSVADPVGRRPHHDPQPAVRPELALGPEPLGRDHNGQKLRHPDGTQARARLEHRGDRVLPRLRHQLLLRSPADLLERIVLGIERLCRRRATNEEARDFLATPGRTGARGGTPPTARPAPPSRAALRDGAPRGPATSDSAPPWPPRGTGTEQVTLPPDATFPSSFYSLPARAPHARP